MTSSNGALTAEWNEEACQALNDAVRRCFPDGTRAEEMPAEIRELLVEQRWQRGGLDVRVRLTPALLRALRTHLNLTEQHDSYQQAQISSPAGRTYTPTWPRRGWD